jgi:RNA polymerase-binding transcription factor DksA
MHGDEFKKGRSASKNSAEEAIMNTLANIPTNGRPITDGALIWNRLHSEREEICAALLKERNDDADLDESGRKVEFKHRELLQARLRQLDDALDRVISGAYGHCSDCNSPIEEPRLTADPALAFCIECQQFSECEHHLRTL